MIVRGASSFVVPLHRFALGWAFALVIGGTWIAPSWAEGPARLDAFGDPLPAGAVARLGTVRLRHASSINAITFTPDGKILVTTGHDGVRVWEAATGRPLRYFGPGSPTDAVFRPGAFVGSASLSPDGRQIALSTNNRYVGVWDVATGRLVQQLGQRPNNPYSCVCFAPDSKHVAALTVSHIGSRPWEITVWDASTGRQVSQWTGPKEEVRSLTFSADGKALLVGGSGKALSFRDIRTGKEVRRLRDLPADIADLVLSPGGDRAAYIEWRERKRGKESSWDVGVRAFLIDLRTGAELRCWAVPATETRGTDAQENGLSALAFSPDGRKLAACSGHGPIRLWDTGSGKETAYLPDGMRYSSGAVAFSPDGHTLAAVRGSHVLRLIDPDTGADRVAATAHDGPVLALAVTADGRTAFTSCDNGTIYRWDVRAGRERGRLLGHRLPVYLLALSPDNRTLFTHSSDWTLRVWDAASGKERRRFQSPSWVFWTPVALSPDGMTLAGVNFTTLLLLNPATGKHLYERTVGAEIRAVEFSSDSSRVMALTADGMLFCWDTKTGRALSQWSFRGPSGEDFRQAPSGYVAALSSGGRFAASADSYKFLRVIDVEARQEVCRLGKPPGWLSTITFAPDGRTLAWAEDHGVIHLLEVATGSKRRTLSGHSGRVTRMAFIADSRLLLSASEDATALVWDMLEPGAATLPVEMRAACWADLADKDAARAYRAMCRLIAAPADALALLPPRLKPVEGMDERQIGRLIAALDADAFAEREKAAEELRKLGELAEPACRKALASRPTLEARRRLRGLLDDVAARRWRLSAELLRQLRAIEVIERIGTPEARKELEVLAAGAAGARLTCEARAALERLTARPSARP